MAELGISDERMEDDDDVALGVEQTARKGAGGAGNEKETEGPGGN
jgi:hypothetical protein